MGKPTGAKTPPTPFFSFEGDDGDYAASTQIGDISADLHTGCQKRGVRKMPVTETLGFGACGPPNRKTTKKKYTRAPNRIGENALPPTKNA